MGLLLCVRTVGVGKSVAVGGIVIGDVFLSSCALLLSALLSAVDCVSVYEMKGVEVVVVKSVSWVVIIVFVVVFGVVGMWSLLRVDELRRGSEARILAARANKLMRNGGIVMGVCGFWVVGGVVSIGVVAVVIVSVKS